MNLFDRAMVAMLPLVPRVLVWRLARRYVAGEHLTDAVARLRQLRADGFGGILDVLGEAIESTQEAEAAAAEYTRALEMLAPDDLDTPISVKPTHLGAMLDRALCERLLSALCARAAADGRRVRLEMEDAPTIDATLAVFEAVSARHDNLGCVIQSRLFRSADDIARLLASRTGAPLDVRLVKGIYLEPASIAWTEDADICRSYVEIARTLLDGGARVGLATHDDALAEACLELVRERGLDTPPAAERRYEFQCLMGVRAPFAAGLRDAGHRVRVYVPYGKDWHAYSMRRLTRNPEIARHVLRAALGFER